MSKLLAVLAASTALLLAACDQVNFTIPGTGKKVVVVPGPYAVFNAEKCPVERAAHVADLKEKWNGVNYTAAIIGWRRNYAQYAAPEFTETVALGRTAGIITETRIKLEIAEACFDKVDTYNR